VREGQEEADNAAGELMEEGPNINEDIVDNPQIRPCKLILQRCDSTGYDLRPSMDIEPEEANNLVSEATFSERMSEGSVNSNLMDIEQDDMADQEEPSTSTATRQSQRHESLMDSNEAEEAQIDSGDDEEQETQNPSMDIDQDDMADQEEPSTSTRQSQRRESLMDSDVAHVPTPACSFKNVEEMENINIVTLWHFLMVLRKNV
jgi:hypothetical protein